MSTPTIGLTPARRATLNRRTRWLAYATAGYNLAEGVVAIAAGAVASSAALIGFGLDSFVEVSSALIVIWQFRSKLPESRERLALRLLAVSFFALAAWVTFESLRHLFGGVEAEASPVGIGLAVASVVVMPALVWAKRRTGRELGSVTVMADSMQTMLCTYLSAILLVGLVLNATLGWTWADPIAALVIAGVAIKEGVEAWRGEQCDDCAPATTAGHCDCPPGCTDYEYGTVADSMKPNTVLRALGVPDMPPVLAWSPDSTRVLTHRLDQRSVREVQWIEARPADGSEPALHTKRYAYPGDEAIPYGELVVIHVASGAVVRANADPIMIPLFSPIQWKAVWWAEDGSAVYYLDQPRDLRALTLKRLDPATGEVTTVLSETGDTRVEANQMMGGSPVLELIGNGDEVLWYSLRDGWGHLYLYDGATGALQRQVTKGEWGVQEIPHVDETERVVYFRASGLIDEDPYRRSICRIGLDGTGFTKLVDDDLDHVVTVSENHKYFLDSASTIATPPVITVRSWDGNVVVELERPSIEALSALGWTPPERFRVKAADGETDIYGVIHLPPGFDPAKRYPVVDSPYPGPQANRVSPAFDPGVFGCMAESVAALGFVVIAVDGRGTPGRSKAFHDESYGKLENGGMLEDHVAALEQLARTRPWLDLDRGVGIFGMSGGGFATVRAMLDFPAVYTVGVSICGPHDNRYYTQAWAETYDGPVGESDYARASNVEAADRLEGQLLLIHGGMDDNVSPQLTMRLVDRLIEADKDFDLLIIPAADHLFLGYDHYLIRKLWDYLVRNHLGAEPPAGYRLKPMPLDMELLAGFFG